MGLGGGFLEGFDGQMGAGDVKRVVLGTFRGRIFILVAKQANTTHMYHYLYKFINKIAFFQFSKIFSRWRGKIFQSFFALRAASYARF